MQYCVCQGDFCNNQNITLQQQAHHWVQKPTEAPEEETTDSDEQQRRSPPTVLDGPKHQQPQSAAPRLPNGLLVPPSSRLPLLPASQSPAVTLITKADRTNGRTAGSNSNSIQEPTSPPSARTTTTEATNPWDNRIRHEGQHRSSASENSSRAEQGKKRGPSSSRQNILDEGDPFHAAASLALPGFLNALALSLLALVLLY